MKQSLLKIEGEMMSIRETFDKIAPSATLFPELTQAEKETNRILVQIANRICSYRNKYLRIMPNRFIMFLKKYLNL